MSKIFELKKTQIVVKSIGDLVPTKVHFGGGITPNKIEFSTGLVDYASCIRCPDTPCMLYTESELENTSIIDFPVDINSNVCPSNAIIKLSAVSAPIINSEFCFSCGICVLRCPVKAIYLTNNGGVIYDNENDSFKLVENVESETVEQTKMKFKNINTVGEIIGMNPIAFNNSFEKLKDIIQYQNQQFPNILVRNLLKSLSVNAGMTRRGDTSLRFDLLIDFKSEAFGIGEVEIYTDFLSAPRSLLEDIAVLKSRYNKERENIIPFAIFLELPNIRSEFWMVIRDIKNVLNVRINTLTIGTLILLVWNRQKLTMQSRHDFYIDIDNNSLNKVFEAILGKEMTNSYNLIAGLFEPLK